MNVLEIFLRPFRFVAYIGVTEDMEPEDIKHINILNLGVLIVLLLHVTLLAVYTWGYTWVLNEFELYVSVGMIISFIFVFLANYLLRHTLARIWAWVSSQGGDLRSRSTLS